MSIFTNYADIGAAGRDAVARAVAGSSLSYEPKLAVSSQPPSATPQSPSSRETPRAGLSRAVDAYIAKLKAEAGMAAGAGDHAPRSGLSRRVDAYIATLRRT